MTIGGIYQPLCFLFINIQSLLAYFYLTIPVALSYLFITDSSSLLPLVAFFL